MGKRRHAAKTGDKKLYLGRNAWKETSDRNSQDIDSFHRGRDESFLALESNKPNTEDDDDERFDTRQNVLDLALGDGDSIEESDDSSGGESQNEQFIARCAPSLAGSSSVDSVDNDDETQSLDQLDARKWGRKKSTYYDGDLGDLELGVQAEDVSVKHCRIAVTSCVSNICLTGVSPRMLSWRKRRHEKFKHHAGMKCRKMTLFLQMMTRLLMGQPSSCQIRS